MRYWLTTFAILSTAGTAAAQMDVSDEDYWVDGVGSEDRGGREGSTSLAEARNSGRGVVLGGTGRIGLMPDVYTVERGDTLWDITGRYYRNPWMWPRVWSFNPEITNPHWIYPQDRIRLVAGGEAPESVLPAPGQSLSVAPAGQGRDGGGGSVFLRDQGYLDRDALRVSGIIVGSPEEHMMLATYDEVYVRFDDDQGVQPNSELTVFRDIEMGSNERNPEESGTLVRVYGTVRISSYDADRHVARAMITEALDPIERGMRVARIPRNFQMVPPVANDRDLAARVVATLHPRQLVGDNQVVFVNVGQEQGVRTGNRFFIVREGDVWRENLSGSEEQAGAVEPDQGEPDEYPPEIVAEGRVVNVRPNTSGLMITRARIEVTVGDRAEMRQGY